jgi:hypothetical protein
MAVDTLETPPSAAAAEERIIEAVDAGATASALEHGTRGALVVAGVSVALLFIGWLAFYFLLFMPRGPIG